MHWTGQFCTWLRPSDVKILFTWHWRKEFKWILEIVELMLQLYKYDS